MSIRPKRRVRMKSDVPINPPRRWKEEEMEALLSCIIKYGHKDLNKIHKHLPGRSIENIKTFMRTIYDNACKMTKSDGILDHWIGHCDAFRNSWSDCIQIAQVVKYLSVDGLLENHPLPERCQGIDFGQAYRLVYQALMGYPMQAVNQATANFVTEALAELNGEIIKQNDAIAKVRSFMRKESKNETNSATNNPEVSNNETNTSVEAKKPIKVYQRKKSVPSTPTETVVPSLRIVVQEAPNSVNSGSGYSKDFSITIEGTNACESTIVNVPQPCATIVDEDEEELLKSSSYNPFKLPKKWLEEPLYLNLLQNL